MNFYRKCNYSCTELASHCCNCSKLLMCEKHIADHIKSKKIKHEISILRIILDKNTKVKFTTSLLKLLADIKVFRSKILSESEKLITKIQEMSIKSLEVLESKSRSYRKLMIMLNSPVTNAEIKEIQTTTRKNINYTEFNGFDQVVSIINPFFTQRISSTQAAVKFIDESHFHSKLPSNKKIPNKKARSLSRTQATGEEAKFNSKIEKRPIKETDISVKYPQCKVPSTDGWICNYCTFENSPRDNPCSLCGKYPLKKNPEDANYASTGCFLNGFIAENPKGSKIPYWDCSCGESNSTVAVFCKNCRRSNKIKTSDGKLCLECWKQIDTAICPQCKVLVRMKKSCSKCKRSLNDIKRCSHCDRIIAERLKAKESV